MFAQALLQALLWSTILSSSLVSSNVLTASVSRASTFQTAQTHRCDPRVDNRQRRGWVVIATQHYNQIPTHIRSVLHKEDNREEDIGLQVVDMQTRGFQTRSTQVTTILRWWNTESLAPPTHAHSIQHSLAINMHTHARQLSVLSCITTTTWLYNSSTVVGYTISELSVVKRSKNRTYWNHWYIAISIISGKLAKPWFNFSLLLPNVVSKKPMVLKLHFPFLYCIVYTS